MVSSLRTEDVNYQKECLLYWIGLHNASLSNCSHSEEHTIRRLKATGQFHELFG